MAPATATAPSPRRRRVPWPAEETTQASLDCAEDVTALAAGLPDHSDEVRLTVASLDQVRLLSLVDPEVTIDRLVLDVVEWERPLARWSGRLGSLAHVAACTVEYPGSGDADDLGDLSPEPAHVDVRLEEPAPLADVVRAVYPLLGVHRELTGHGRIELGTADLPQSGLALLPTPTAPGIPKIPSIHLLGLGLSRADLGLVGTSETLERMRAVADDPEQTTFGDSLLVDRSGHLAVSERTDRPVIDLNVHNPIGRLHTFDHPAARLALRAENGSLTFEVLPEPRRLRHADRRREQPDADWLASRRPTTWSRPLPAPLSGPEVRRLRDIESLDLSALHPASPDEDRLLARRLAELAATGVILHDLPDAFSGIDEVFGAELAERLRAPYSPSFGLVRELRTVPQRRAAMARFGGFFELAEHAAARGHQLLPTVSVILSTMRPSRVAAVLMALAAQSYPHLEVAVALHGVSGDSDASFREAVRASGAQVLSYERSVPFGSVLADAARRTSGDLVVKIDDDDFYGPRVIEDLVLAYLYSNAEVVGKTTEYLYFEGIDHTAHRRFVTERYHTQVAGGAMMLSRAALNDIGGWRPSHHSTDRSVLIRIGNAGGLCYRCQSLGYVYVRHSDGHTWKQQDSQLLRKSPEQWPRFLHEIVES